jgi:cytochrome P450
VELSCDHGHSKAPWLHNIIFNTVMTSPQFTPSALSFPAAIYNPSRKDAKKNIGPLITPAPFGASSQIANPLLTGTSNGSHSSLLANIVKHRAPKKSEHIAITIPSSKDNMRAGHPQFSETIDTAGSCPFTGNANLSQFFAAYECPHASSPTHTLTKLGDIYRNFPSTASLFKAGPIFPGVPHLRNYNLTALFSGQGSNLMNSRNFYQFIRNHVHAFLDQATGGKPNYGLASMWFSDIRVLYIGSGKHMRLLFQTRNMTQSTLEGQQIGPLGFLEEIVGKELNFVLQDSYGKDNKLNKDYSKARQLVSTITLDADVMNNFIQTKMIRFIRQNLDDAAKTGKTELTNVFLGMAMDIGLGAMAGIDTFMPSSLIKAGDDNRDFFETFLTKLADPNLVLDQPQRARLIEEQQRKMTGAGHLIIKRNYADIVATDPSAIKKMWAERNRLLDPTADVPPFPETHDAFLAFAAESPEKKAICDKLALSTGFLLLASSETSAMAMNFATRQLFNHPQLFQDIRKEAANFVHKHGGFEQIRRDNLKEMPILSAFVLEVLRRHPSVPMIPWVAKKDYTVRLDGKDVEIPKGTWLILDFERANQSEWKDGAQFDPQRWLDPQCSYQKDFGGDIAAYLTSLQNDQAGFHTFSGDSSKTTNNTRVCPGRWLAVPEIMSAIAILAHEYDISTEEKNVSCESDAPSTLRPTQPIEVTVTRRSSHTRQPSVD